MKNFAASESSDAGYDQILSFARLRWKSENVENEICLKLASNDGRRFNTCIWDSDVLTDTRQNPRAYSRIMPFFCPFVT
jgi:hypothetical protein